MNFSYIQKFEGTDIGKKSSNCVEPHGFNKNYTFGEMLELAFIHNCSILVKHGRGKWYLKCQNKNPNNFLKKIEQNKNKECYKTCKLWILTFNVDSYVGCHLTVDRL